MLQSDNTLFAGANRPNLTGAGFETPGDFADRLASADHPTATWLNPAAFTAAPAGTFGNAPRLITDVRTPMINNTDLSVAKNIGLSGGRVQHGRDEKAGEGQPNCQRLDPVEHDPPP